MIGQAAGWWAFGGEAAEALADAQRFFAEQEVNIVGFTPVSFFAYIIFMGVSISAGAIGQLWRKQWGLILIGLYLLSHAALFVNFMAVNRKVEMLGLAVLLTLILVWANRMPKPENEPHPA